MSIEEIIERQREYFRTGTTLNIEFRIQMLKKLRAAVQTYEHEIAAALKEDLGKSDYESFMCEIGLAMTEITYMIKHVRSLAKERTVWTPLAQFASRSYTKPSPYGNVLIMSPWNYPFLLTIEPLADAIAAGNTVIIKPSAYSPSVAQIVVNIVEECFPEEYVAVITGGRKENAALLKQKFDFIFFTGSTSVGKEVLRNAAEHLTPVVLELGGKSPCIVDQSADLELAAKRIVFGKYLNCGQTCVAPDYILCHKDVKEQFVQAVKKQIIQQFGNEPLLNPDYGRIISDKHFDRICSLMIKEKIVHGGHVNRAALQIEPTVMDHVMWDDAVMQEEIFGPLMPILTFDSLDEVIRLLQHQPKPLALYLFTKDKKAVSTITEQVQYGGGCINDVVIHLATSEMPFGGVGESGMGSYHGKEGFHAFSHTKSIVDKKTWLDLPMRYQPYQRKRYKKLLKMFLK